MSSVKSRAWIGMAAVEGLKDQGCFARWNYAIRSLHQHAKSSDVRSFTQAKKLSGHIQSSSVVSKKMVRERDNHHEKKLKQSEESLKNVMYLNCWGPN